jgi:radical S-adenosyl methionine domain-containing protein 2
MKTSSLPSTVNLHNLVPCNYRCGFCYAGFASAKRTHIPQAELHEILRQIASVPVHGYGSQRKVTFAGGEPLLSPTVLADIGRARSLGLVTSLVTNGSLLDQDKINRLAPVLDWLTISIPPRAVHPVAPSDGLLFPNLYPAPSQSPPPSRRHPAPS